MELLMEKQPYFHRLFLKINNTDDFDSLTKISTSILDMEEEKKDDVTTDTSSTDNNTSGISNDTSSSSSSSSGEKKIITLKL